MKLVHSKLKPGQVIRFGIPDRTPHLIVDIEPGGSRSFVYLQPHDQPKAQIEVREIRGMRDVLDLPISTAQRALIVEV